MSTHGSDGQGKSGNFKKSGKVREKLKNQEKSGNFFPFQSQGKLNKSENSKVPGCKS